MVVFSKDIGVKVCDSQACTYGLLSQIGVHCILIVYLCVKVRGARWLTPTNLPP